MNSPGKARKKPGLAGPWTGGMSELCSPGWGALPSSRFQRGIDMALMRSGLKVGMFIPRDVVFLTLNPFRGICPMGDGGECWAWGLCRKEVGGAQTPATLPGAKAWASERPQRVTQLLLPWFPWL